MKSAIYFSISMTIQMGWWHFSTCWSWETGIYGCRYYFCLQIFYLFYKLCLIMNYFLSLHSEWYCWFGYLFWFMSPWNSCLEFPNYIIFLFYIFTCDYENLGFIWFYLHSDRRFGFLYKRAGNGLATLNLPQIKIWNLETATISSAMHCKDCTDLDHPCMLILHSLGFHEGST